MRPKPVTWCNLLKGVGCLAMFEGNFFVIHDQQEKTWLLPFSKGNLTTLSNREKCSLWKVSYFYAKWSEFTQCLVYEDQLISSELNVKINKPSP